MDFTKPKRHRNILLTLVVALTASCAPQSDAETSTNESLEPSSTAAVDIQSVKNEFHLRLAQQDIRPSASELSDIFRRNELYGELGNFKGIATMWVEPLLCEAFTTADLLNIGSKQREQDYEFYQDTTAVSADKQPDVFYSFTFKIINDIDTNRIQSNALGLGDIIFLNSEKQCTGTVGTVLEGDNWSGSTNFKTGYFPEPLDDGIEILHYLQSGFGRERFARTVTLILLEPANSAVEIVVTAFNLRPIASPITSDEMLLPLSQISREIKNLWARKIRADPNWLTIKDGP